MQWKNKKNRARRREVNDNDDDNENGNGNDTGNENDTFFLLAFEQHAKGHLRQTEKTSKPCTQC